MLSRRCSARSARPRWSRSTGWRPALPGRVALKLEYYSPGGSVKDRVGAADRRGRRARRTAAARRDGRRADQRQHGDRAGGRLRGQGLPADRGHVGGELARAAAGARGARRAGRACPAGRRRAAGPGLGRGPRRRSRRGPTSWSRELGAFRPDQFNNPERGRRPRGDDRAGDLAPERRPGHPLPRLDRDRRHLRRNGPRRSSGQPGDALLRRRAGLRAVHRRPAGRRAPATGCRAPATR